MAEPYHIHLSNGRVVHVVKAIDQAFAALRAATPVFLAITPTTADGLPLGGIEAIRSDHIVSIRVPQSQIDRIGVGGESDAM